jgi:protein-S-isoprenylcysteine O-methyltransferase Ste14
MQMDIRLPIGLLFSILGVVITVFGFATKGAEIYKHSLNININIYTGICLLIFGAFMLVMAMRAHTKNKASAAK